MMQPASVSKQSSKSGVLWASLFSELGLAPDQPARVSDSGSGAGNLDVYTFVNDHVIIDDAQGDADTAGTMPFTLWEAQRTLLASIARERLLLILKARQLGISWLVCAYAVWL